MTVFRRIAHVSLILSGLLPAMADSGLGQCTPPTRNFLLVATDGGARRDTAFFGHGPTATIGLDTSLCERELPPLPPTGVYDLRFSNPPGRDGLQPPAGLGQGTVRDYRTQVGPSQTDTFRVRFQPGLGGFPMTFSWSPAALTAVYDSVRLLDELGGVLYSVNMLALPSLTVTNPAVGALLLITHGMLAIPAAPALVSPANHASNQSTALLLSWSAAAGATRYTVQVATDSLFASLLLNDTSVVAASRAVSGLPSGTSCFWRVRASNGAGTGPWSTVWSFTTAGPVTNSYGVQGGWNVVSLPLAVANGRRAVVYPSASSTAFSFGSSGYVPEDSLRSGVGYWLKFPSAQNVSVTGLAVLLDTVQVQAGWNLVGTISVPVDTGLIQRIPPGLLLTSFFGFSGSYVPVGTLQPGSSYWVKAASAGSLVIPAPAAVPARRRPGASVPLLK
jgi:hypothetical protein